ncbi:hypothetical protein GQS_00500 [Thermococcus sp. 4557]|nr:hypothetical protein GQS_00500 [Thermococcus sp. 4557]
MRIKFLAVAFALLLILGTFGLAVPRINISAQEIGAGSNYLVSPVNDGRYTIWTSGNTVTNVELILGGSLSEGTMVYVDLRDSSGNMVSNGSLTVGPGGIPGGVAFNVSVSSTDISGVDPTKTEVIILSSEYNLDSSGPIFVSIQKLGLGTYDGSYSNPITIHGSAVYLNHYPVRILLVASSPSFPWDSLYFTNSTGHCLYYWKEFQGTFVNSDGNTYSWAVFWVNVTTIAPDSDETIFVNYLGTGNSCSSYLDPNKVFLFYDDFNNLANWEIRGSPAVSNGRLVLDGGDWVWTKQSFPTPYAVEMLVNLGWDDGTSYNKRGINTYSLGPFIVPYVDSGGDGWGEGIGTRYLFGVIPLSQEDGAVNFNVYSSLSSLSWSYQQSTPQYVMGIWEILNATVYANTLDFSQTVFVTYQSGNGWVLSSSPSTGIPMGVQDTSSYPVSITSEGRVGIGQWSGGPTEVEFLFVRKYVNPEPTYDIGRWYYHLTFIPEPAAASATGTAVASTTAPAIAPVGKAGQAVLSGYGLGSKRQTVPQFQNMNNITGSGNSEVYAKN